MVVIQNTYITHREVVNSGAKKRYTDCYGYLGNRYVTITNENIIAVHYTLNDQLSRTMCVKDPITSISFEYRTLCGANVVLRVQGVNSTVRGHIYETFTSISSPYPKVRACKDCRVREESRINFIIEP